jgi:hypothetical protein
LRINLNEPPIFTFKPKLHPSVSGLTFHSYAGERNGFLRIFLFSFIFSYKGLLLNRRSYNVFLNTEIIIMEQFPAVLNFFLSG